jgi:hypothetical protein
VCNCAPDRSFATSIFHEGNDSMSAISHPAMRESFASKPILAGVHADHRPQDIFFARTQSPAMRKLEWESRMKPLRSWGPVALWGLAILMFVAASASLVR